MSNPQDHQKSPEQHEPPETSQQKQNEGESKDEQNQSEITMPKLKASETDLLKIQKMITETHGRELWVAVKTGIAVVAATSMKQRSNPLVVIFEGGSGRGKSFIINVLEPDRPETHKYLCRLDSFTPKAFVSHAANRSKEKLKEIDLLPKLKDRTLLVKELAPIFRGREDSLRENFATLTAVLDGKGLMSASGTHGTRGYQGRYVFNWIGATTPIPPETDRIMSQLGNRMFRYEIAGAHSSEEDLKEFARSYTPTDKEDEYRKAVNSFIEGHFNRYPVNRVEPTEIVFGEAQVEQLVRCARLICVGRVEVTVVKPHWSDCPEYVAGLTEGPHRVIIGLKLLAQALALISGRAEVSDEDLEIIRHIAFSSLPQNRRLMLRALLVKNGYLTSVDAEKELRISRPTARNWMKELGATGLAEHKYGDGNGPDSLTLSEDFSWLLGKKEPPKGESREDQDDAKGEAEPTVVAAESH